MKILTTPIMEEDIIKLSVGDMLYISGDIFCGRDAVLPLLVESLKIQPREEIKGSAIFHTAVSIAGVGPTSSNKLEIESSIGPLSEAGVKMHIGKGQLHRETIELLDRFNSVYAVIAPVTALLGEKMISKEIVDYEELGMEAFYKIRVQEYPIIIAAAHGRSIYDERWQRHKKG